MEEIEEDIKSEFDTILEIRIDKAGLNAIYSIDPPIEVFVKTSVRLIRTRDGQELLKDIIVCRSDEEKRINDWIKDGGESLTEEFKGCVPEVAEKIIDDFFLVYPICRDRNRLFNDTAQ
jgi:pheromone shutdown protein TraB